MCHHGGPAAGWVSFGTLTDAPLTDMTIMMSSDTPMATALLQARVRVTVDGRASSLLTLVMGRPYRTASTLKSMMDGCGDHRATASLAGNSPGLACLAALAVAAVLCLARGRPEEPAR